MSREAGVPEEQLREINNYRDSSAFLPLEKLVIEYAEQMTRTPAKLDEELFAALREQLDEKQLVELTAIVAWENFTSRFNRAFAVEAQGFSEGAYCVVRSEA